MGEQREFGRHDLNKERGTIGMAAVTEGTRNQARRTGPN
jgi:hypothetical protein